MQKMLARWMLPLILIGSLVFTIALLGATPYRSEGFLVFQRGPDNQPLKVIDIGNPDERQHANYVKHLMEGKGFPVLRPGSPDLGETYQSHQPPLYYVLAVGWSKLVGADPADPSSGRKLRWLNALIGPITLLGIFFVARWGGCSEEFSLLATMFAGFLPMFLALHGAVSNDPLLFAICTWVLAFTLRYSDLGWTLPRALGLGVLVGLGLLTKTTALVLIPVFLVGVWLAQRAGKAQLIHYGGALVSIVIAFPWFLRNNQLYGDFLGLKVFQEAFVNTAQKDFMIQLVAAMREAQGLSPSGAAADYWLNWFGWWTLRSFFGAFSQMDIFYDPNLYRILGLVALALLVGAYLQRRGQKEGWGSPLNALGGLLTLLVALLFLRFNLTYFQAQARYLYPAIAPIVILLATGARPVLRKSPAWVLASVFGLLVVGNIQSLRFVSAEFQKRTAFAKNSAQPLGVLARSH